MNQNIPRRRSVQRLVPEKGVPKNSSRPSTHAGDRPQKLPLWQVILLVVVCVAMLMAALHYSVPRSRARRRSVSTGGTTFRCFPLTDKERVRLIAEQNKAAGRTIATSSDTAQLLFNLGLLQAFGFERGEAAENFKAALRFDPQCAMCYWGLAYASGPYPNVMVGKTTDKYPVFTTQAAAQAEEFATTAVRLAKQAVAHSRDTDLSEREVELTTLMAMRFHDAANTINAGDAHWYRQEQQYAEAMAVLGEKLVNDADVFTLAAEAFMNLQPWDYYSAMGNMRPHAVQAEKMLRRALHADSRHALALHLHIHVTEASAPTLKGAHNDKALWAGRALGSADALVALAPMQGHLLHMPSHTYLRVGHYKTAVECNQRAYNFDSSHSTHCIAPYLPEHNVNMLIYAASMAGMMHTAEAHSRGVRTLRDRVVDKWMAKGSEWTSLPLVLARYGEWKKVLQVSPPLKDARDRTTHGGAQYSEVIYHTVRVLALAAKAEAYTVRTLSIGDRVAFDLAAKGADGRHADVQKELQLLRAAMSRVPEEQKTRPGHGIGMYASAYRTLAKIHGALAEARVTLLLNHTAQAIDLLEEAAAHEEELGYMEPPRLHQPARQCLGWVLLKAGKVSDAEDTYHKDLERYPENGWSLTGLIQSAEARGSDGAESASKARRRFDAAWAAAEVAIGSSCPALARPFELGTRTHRMLVAN